ncbi:glycosyltransferase family 4 protein [Asticcacaulis excentricus]|uniref:Glycosyl transferase group 1 n=1 Tax=Asticcacaulis excentricus (strain ATCC 15261 / DSM 4724 / KCTC 12464 / NCIMB 9791 / VKM B-1370 / CB 48) TaxID=573065 RepID=E8RM98_ASTEC|nr:glycosyltransferase family 4 protein [Asticcacaulis excentricus]ADU13849.1 glycosyl transferase group 1 [Asticcacaulis excentricus CB 48]
MRILHLSNHCIFGNGNVHAAVDLACEQAKQGHEVFFASSGGDFEDLLEENGVRHVKIVHPNKHAPWLALPAAIAIFRLCRRKNIQIVHAHMMTGAVLGWAATRFLGIPLITTVHNAFDQHAVLMGLGDRVIAVSAAVAETMKRRGVSEKKLRTVLNGTLGSPRTSGPIMEVSPLYHPSITTVCGLHDRKGVRYLLTAFEAVHAQYPEAHLYVLGEGPQENEYKSIATASPSGANIHFLGQVRDPRPYLKQTDIFVLASLQDPCPLVIPEAREMGCAIVATNVDGIPEMLSIGAAGNLVPPRDDEAIRDKIILLLSEQEKLIESKETSLRLVQHFQISRVFSETIKIYNEFESN